MGEKRRKQKWQLKMESGEYYSTKKKKNRYILKNDYQTMKGRFSIIATLYPLLLAFFIIVMWSSFASAHLIINSYVF